LIYLTNGNMPLNAAYADEIVQEDNSTYQLSFRFPTSDPLWEKLKEETFLTADDLHGEQDFVIFEIEKKHGYIQVYANQVFTLLNNYVVNPISLDRQTGSTALSRFAGSITRDNPFSFFSDIEDRHTFNIGSKNAMEAFAKDKHSIIGQWGGDLVRHSYQVRLLKNGGSENESLFMYKKNLSSYQHKTSTKSLKTRITFIATVKGEGEKAPDRTFTVTIDSPLINKYSQIYEDVIEVSDQDVKDEASLRKYGEQYYRTSLCDMMEDSLEIEVVGQSDVPVQMFDVVSIFHERYNLDVRKKITKYTYSPMAKKLKSIGFGQFQSGLANAIGNAVSDAVNGEVQQLQGNFERQLARELKNADLAFERHKEELVNQFTDDVNAIKAKAEEAKQEMSDTIDQRFNSFNNGPLQEAKRKAEEALKNAGASSLLAQEAKRIGLDSIAKLEAFKSQATSAQTALSGVLDALKRTIANDIRPKQAQAEADIAKQVKVLGQTRDELLGIKSAQATYEETTTRRLSELTNLANGKASKSELTQTAEELASKIASVRVGGVNLFKGSRDFSVSWANAVHWARENEKYKGLTVMSRTGSWLGLSQPFEAKKGETYTFSFYIKSSAEREQVNVYFVHNSASPQARVSLNVSSMVISDEWQRLSATFKVEESGFILPRIERFNADNRVYVAGLKLEQGTIATDYSEAPEDIEGQISAVESIFKQRADALDAGVSRLTEGLRTKADISSLNVTAENIRQSVKQLETSTQNQLNQMLSLAEFEVRAGSIRQEILNATKDKADKTLVTAEAGKLREEFSKLRVGGTNLLKGSKGPFLPDRKPANFDNNVLYAGQTSVHMEQGQEYIISAKTDGNFTAHHDGNKESDNVVLWIMDKDIRNYQIVSDLKTGTTGTKIIWNKPTGIYHLRVNTYHKNAAKSVWDVKIEKGTLATDWSPAPEDTDGLITEAKATFERTAQGLRTDLSAIQSYVDQDGQRQETLKSYVRNETITRINIYRQDVARNYILRSRYDEDANSIRQQFEAITNSQNGLIATKIADYKHSVDGRFAEITSLLSGKASQVDFQRVQETSRLYERILGNTDNGIANNVARMALTSQLFQVEVSKASASGRNLFLNSLFKRDLRDKYSTYKLYDDNTQTKGQLAVSIDSDNQFRGVNTLKIVSTFNGKFDNQKITFSLGGNSRTGRVDELKNKSVRFSFWAKSTVNNTILQARPGYRGSLQSIPISTDWKFYDIELVRKENSNATSELILHILTAATVWIAFPKVEIGTESTPFSEAPEDTDEAIRSVQSQLAGSWAVQNINSAGDLISGINLGANGHNRFVGKLTHITGETLIDRAVIKSAMVDKLKTANFEAGSVTTIVLDAEAVTAEKLKVDQAFFNKLVANEAYLSQLFAKQAFINRVQSVAIDASQVRSGILSGDRIYGGTIRGVSIYGGTLTGHTQIQLGSYGSFDTVNGGLQINVPRTVNARDGLGVQFIGSYGRGENVPYGLFIYKDTDFTTDNYASDSDDFLLTVEGYIKAKGIGWLKTVKGNVGGKDTASIGFWNSDVSLDFGGSGNDIYYRYAGKAYGLWSIINQHFSDRRLKENIVDCKHKALDYIHQFQFKEYDWKNQEDRPRQAHTKIGLIAQEVQEVDPTLVYENGDTLNLDNLRLTTIALKAIQELSQRIETLERKIA
jgi:phage minor structural protein, N-terminal domain protein